MIFNVGVSAPLRPIMNLTIGDTVYRIDGSQTIEVPNQFKFVPEGTEDFKMWIYSTMTLNFDFIGKQVAVCAVGKGNNGGRGFYNTDDKYHHGGTGGSGGEVLSVNALFTSGTNYIATVNNTGTSLVGTGVNIAPVTGGGSAGGIGTKSYYSPGHEASQWGEKGKDGHYPFVIYDAQGRQVSGPGIDGAFEKTLYGPGGGGGYTDYEGPTPYATGYGKFENGVWNRYSNLRGAGGHGGYCINHEVTGAGGAGQIGIIMLWSKLM